MMGKQFKTGAATGWRRFQRTKFVGWVALFQVASLWSVCELPAMQSPIDFATEIAPILADHCIRCHSTSDENDVTLATIDDLLEQEYVIAGQPENSILLKLVGSVDGEPPEMPPEGTPLSEDQVQLLSEWIRQGAQWPEAVVVQARSKADSSWWAYQPLSPTADRSINDFIREQLAEAGLTLRPMADRRTLIRRLSYDLHGLPPAPEAVEAFVRDPAPDAYQRLVDRMLDSPRYGERYAQHWLDIAHYADTHGFERDQRRDHAWRYRDYVIGAFNNDKPYDRFIQEQIAGDVLWPDEMDAVIATGFLAAGPWDFVGQVETKSPSLRRAARSLDLDDMATQVLTATMATTVHCARCHDHKLDPISQREYYQLRAVFAGVNRGDRVVLDNALEEYEGRRKQISSRRSEVDFEIGRLEGTGFNLADVVGGGNGLGNGSARQGIDPRNAKVQTRDFGKLGNVVTNRFSESDFLFVDGVFIPDGEHEAAEIPITSTGLTITGLPTTSGDAWDVIRNGPVASQHSPELEGIDFRDEGHSLLGLHANAGISFDLAPMRRALGNQTLHFTAKLGYFGAEGNHHADAWIVLDGQLALAFQKLKRADGIQTVDLNLPDSIRFLTLVSTDGGNGFGHDQIGFGDPQVAPTSPPALSADDAQRLKTLRQERQRLDEELKALGPPPKFYGLIAETSVPEIRLLDRGNPETEVGEPLSPAAFSCLAMLDPNLGSFESSEGERRAALARWITDRNNPLTYRVIVNRLWQWHFGRGIVDTSSDFGYGGGRPSHPKLLDWMALELQRHQGSLKAMHRLILTSETYKQDSRHAKDASGLAVDADNRLLWRQNPRRLEAEAIRDSVLSVTGKLNLEGGGPGFEDFKYQDAYAPIYSYVTADQPALWRRSIYRYIVRTTPNRFLTTLDCPDPANLTPQRLTTTTPLQSLTLFNNDFMLKQSRYFAERLEHEAGPDLAGQVQRAFQIAFGREPSEPEQLLSTNFINDQGLFAFCRTILNSNEFIYVD